ncbi:hypothetical protein BGX24_010244 [Mortierella sp. AD032]|nr:hypothetical protein BGX24_010244 [Mortierella sp. AD032]
MTRIFQTHSLELHEVRSRIASSLGHKDLASCARVSQNRNDSFTPPLLNSVVLSKYGPCKESVERNKHRIQSMKIQSRASDEFSSTSTQNKVFSSIIDYSTLAILDLEANWIGPIETQALVEALKTNATLTTLKLQYSPIGDCEAHALSEALKTNSTLTTLYLQDNSIGPNGAQALSEALKTNSTLTTLNISSNSIGDNGAQALADALKTNSSLTTLILWNNSIGPNGAQALSGALATNPALTTLDLYENPIGDNEAQALSEKLEINLAMFNMVLELARYVADLNQIPSNGRHRDTLEINPH